MDGPPPAKKARNESPDLNTDLSWNPLEINSELPDELGSINCQPLPTTTASSSSIINKKADDTILRHHNLSQLLSSTSDLHGPCPLNSSHMPSRHMIASNHQQFRHHSTQPPQQHHHHQPYSLSMSAMARPNLMTGSAHAFANNSASSIYASQNPLISGNYGPPLRQYAASMRLPMSNSTNYFAHNSRMSSLNGTIYSPHGANGPSMGPGDAGFGGSQFAPSSGGMGDAMYCNQVNMGNKMAMQVANGSLSGQQQLQQPQHRPGNDLKNSLTSSISANCEVMYSSGNVTMVGNASSSSVGVKNPVGTMPSTPKPGVMSPDAVSGVCPVSPAISTSEALDPSSVKADKRREIQNQLVLLLHAHNCIRQDGMNGLSSSSQGACSASECIQMRAILKHMSQCVEGHNCKTARCVLLRRIILHFKSCQNSSCLVCSPVRNKRNHLMLSMSAPPPSTSAASVESSSQPQSNSNAALTNMDMYQACVTLDPRDHMNPMTPQGSSSLVTRQTCASSVGSLDNHKTVSVSSALLAEHSNSLSLPPFDSVSDNASRPRKPWHLDMTDNHREHLVQKLAVDLAFAGREFFEECSQQQHQDGATRLRRHQYDHTTIGPTAAAGHQRYFGNDSKAPSLVQAIFPSAPDLNVVRQDQMNSLVRYARKVEGDMYDNADSKEDYYHLLAQKIYKIQKELEEKRMKRLMDNSSASSSSSSLPGTPLQASIALQSRLPQFGDNRCLDLFVDGHSSNPPTSSVVRSQTPQFVNARSFPPQDMYGGVRIVRPQSASGATSMFPDGHLSTAQPGCHSAMSVDGFPNQRPNFPNTKHDLPFGSQDVIGPSTLHDQLPPSNLLLPTQPSQSSLLQQQMQQIQQQPFANSSQATISSAQQQQQQAESQSPYHRVGGPSPCSNPLVSSGVQSSTTSPSVFGVNGDRTPGPVSCNPPPMTSPVGNFKMAVKHEDITDDEVTVKSEPRSPEDFKYTAAQQPVHEDITDDEAEAAAAATAAEAGAAAVAAVEVKMEEVKKEETAEEEEAVGLSVDTKTDIMLDDSSGEVKAEVKDVAGDREAVLTEEEEKMKVEEAKDQKTELDSPLEEEGPRGRKVWKSEELQTALIPILEKLFCLDEAIPFREPVDAVALGIFDYHDIIKNPMDLSTIRGKLESGSYAHPWQFVDDINLMFDNAWLYNRKTSKVYKFCSKLAEVFESAIDPVMQSLGFCCGRRYVFSPQVLCCFGKQLCTIPRDTIYYNFQDRYIYCEKCFNDLRGDDVEMADDPSQPGLKIRKDQFVKEKNDKLDYEQFVGCSDCHRKMHKICVLHMEQIWTEGFTCDACLKAKKMKRKDNKHSARRLPTTKLATYLETRVNALLKRKDSGSGDVTIRVLSCYDKTVEVKAGMKARYVASGGMPENIPYRVKAIFAFEEIDGVDVCFFGMHVQEYGSDCYATNARRVYIAYLDSVHYFQPRHFRTTVYHEILIGYMDYAKSLGYQFAHIWACPPSEGDDYIFHCHPLDQKIPKPKRLQEWYKKMLDKALNDRVISDYKDILRDAVENNFVDVTDMPYFEGDFWPNILEDGIKELEQEELEKRRREEEEAAADATLLVDFEPLIGDSVELQTLAGKKKGQKSGNIKKKNTKSKKLTNRKSKAALSHNGTDLSTKLLTTMEKHKEGFFVIRLQSSNEPTEIRDPDPLINCDLMDGRDAFLTLARDKHYEFSSLRRAKYASMGLLLELHNQAKDGFVYSCNDCRANVETRYHCSICDDFDLCIPCFKKSDHPHKGKMTKLGLDLDDNSSGVDAVKTQNPEEARRQSAQSYVQYLEHASQCRDANCRSTSCQKMKRNLAHVKTCGKGHAKGCPTCKGMLQLIYAHAKVCKETKCLVPFCPQVKQKFQQKRAQQQFKQQQLMRRRIALMQHTGGPEKETASTVQAQPTSDPPTPGVSGPHGGVGGGCGIGGKYMFGMTPSPPTGALMAARQAEHTAQRQAGIGMSSTGGYQMQGMAIQQQQQLQRSMMMTTPNHMMDQQQQHAMMYSGSVGPGSGPMMSMQEEMMYHSHQQHGMHGPPPHPMDQMCLQQQQQLQHQQLQQQLHQLQPGQATSKQIAMLVAKVKAQSSPQQNPEVMTMLKQNPQLMASFIKQSHSQQSMSSGGGQLQQQHMMSPGMNSHVMDGMMDDPGGTMCNMPPSMIMSGMMSSGQGPDSSGQPRMSSSQWLQQQHHQMRSLHPDYGGQQFPHHMALGGGGGGMYGSNMSQMHRMRMNFGGGGGGPLHQQQQQSPYISDDMIPMYGGPSGHSQQHQQEMQMQMMQQRRLQARPRMDGGAGQSVNLPGGMVISSSQRGIATISHPPSVDMHQQQQQPPSFPSSLPSNSALASQPSTRTHTVLGKVTPSPRRPPPHYSDSVLMHQQGGASSVTGGTMQRTSAMVTAIPSGATDLNPYASAVAAADQARLRFPVGTTPDFGGTTGGHSSSSTVDSGLQYSKNNPPSSLRDSFSSRFVNSLPK